jgi:hypothetical protein
VSRSTSYRFQIRLAWLCPSKRYTSERQLILDEAAESGPLVFGTGRAFDSIRSGVGISWLNMLEIEIVVLAAQCLDRRVESTDQLIAETAAWGRARGSSALASKANLSRADLSRARNPIASWL